jgi:hypothetical protein
MLVLVTADDSFPPPDSIFALPSQSHAYDGDVVTVEVYSRGAANALKFLDACGITLEQGNSYALKSFNVGEISADPGDQTPDGVWADASPDGFLLAPDEFIVAEDIGDSRQRIDFIVVPLSSVEVPQATGPLFNFGLTVHSSVTFGFQRSGVLARTYYSDAQGATHFWATDSNSGLPGILLQ